MKSILLVIFLVSIVASNFPVYLLYNGQIPAELTPGQNFTTGFDDHLHGSQFYIWVPQNVSRIRIQYSTYSWSSAALYGKWGSFPCDQFHYFPASVWCGNSHSIGETTNGVLATTINAFDSKGMDYWDSDDSDFIRGDYLYLQSGLTFGPCSDCYATINIDFDYCPSGTVVAEGTSDSKCVPYTSVTSPSSSHNVTVNAPYEKFWVVSIPETCSGIQASIITPTSNWFYMYGRYSSGGTSDNYYNYKIVQGYGNQTIFWPNLPVGEFVITVSNTLTAPNIQFTLKIEVKTCSIGFTSDDYGNCTFPFTLTSMTDLSSNPTTVVLAKSSKSEECNWKVYGFHIPPLSMSYFNLTVTNLTSVGTVYIRKNAWPTTRQYDATTYWLTASNYTWTWAPDDMYVPQGIWYYIGFCNRVTNQTTSWTMTSSYSVPSATPSPSATASVTPTASPTSSVTSSEQPSTSATPSPSFGFTPSPSASPEAESSGTVFIVSVILTMGAIVTVF